jgi:DNA repair ATPase RecN/histidinol phosphatase-like PHP family hydrolase
MAVLDEILIQSTGARFFRADLHIHSFGASHDVKDSRMTSSAIVETAAREGLTIIALTDHNEIDNVESAIQAAQGSSVYVIPGIELSTLQGHLLCYLPTLNALRRFHGQLSIVERGLPTSHCQQSILDCLNLLSPLAGFGVLAHVDVPSGFEIQTPGASPHKTDVLCHSALLGIELKHATSQISYAEGDSDPERAKMGRERISRLKLGSKQNLARVLNSDAHALDALGHNAANARRVTRYKMDSPSFDGLRVALEDADARVRIEDQIPQAVPRILGIHINGGFLSGQVIQFSPNLNCIIGGRGTGKSTAFEAVRCIIGEPSESTVVDSEAWPDELYIVWEDQAGQQHTLFRPKDDEILNIDNPETGPCYFEVDCFGQGEAARISMQAQTDPLALLNYLDRFVELEDAIAAEESARDQLLTLQTEIEKAEQNVLLIPQYERLLATTQQQLAALKKPEVKELIELQQQLATERELRDQILQKLREAKTDVVHGSPKATIQEIQALAEPGGLSVGVAEFQAILDGATSFESTIGTAEAQIKAGLSGFEKIVSTQIAKWKAKDTEAQKKVDAKKRELEALKVKFDMSYITKLAKDEASYQQNVKNLHSWEPHLKEQKRQRAAVLKERWAARDRIALLRDTFARRATATLRESLSDLQVSLKYAANAYSPDATDQIIQVMGWRTNQQARASWLVQTLTIPVLLECIQKNDLAPVLAIKTSEGIEVFKRDEAQTIIERLGEPPVRFALERAALHDLPRLRVSRTIADGEGGTQHITRDFAKLSLGQQQSVLLALILSSDSNRPLIIDQPEDNLDGEFIYTTLVPVLRRAKERRQVIIVTHNPNVAVLGDAELVVVMKAMNDRGEIVARGSIDHPETRDAACAILEGAREAFLRRAKMYGIQVR